MQILMEWEWLIQHFQCSNNGAGFHEEKTGIKLTLYPQQWRTKIWFHEDIAGCCWLEMISGVRGLQLHSTSLLWDLTKVQLPKPGLSSEPLLGQGLKQMFWSFLSENVAVVFHYSDLKIPFWIIGYMRLGRKGYSGFWENVLSAWQLNCFCVFVTERRRDTSHDVTSGEEL